MDRFKMRAWHKEQKKMYEVESICPYEDDSTKGGEVFLKGIEKKSFYFPEEVEVMFSTGKRDKNKKPIYEGDIVRYSEYDNDVDCRAEWDYAEVVWGGDYDYPAFDLKDTDFDGTNGLSYIFGEGWTIEVCGNIYENPDILEDKR